MFLKKIALSVCYPCVVPRGVVYVRLARTCCGCCACHGSLDNHQASRRSHIAWLTDGCQSAKHKVGRMRYRSVGV